MGTMNAAEAFKLGFASVLAEHRLSPGDLVTACTKLAAADFVGKVAPLGTGLSLALPLGLGHAAGSTSERLLSEDLESPELIRKQYLIRRLQQLLNAERAKANNKLVTQALQA
jgi:hypothetical protein